MSTCSSDCILKTETMNYFPGNANDLELEKKLHASSDLGLEAGTFLPGNFND